VLSAVLLSAVLLSAVLLSAVLLSAVLLSAVLLSAVLLSAVLRDLGRGTLGVGGSCKALPCQERHQWRLRQDLNLRPLAPEASALSAELRRHVLT
jgi:hypothetical protein